MMVVLVVEELVVLQMVGVDPRWSSSTWWRRSQDLGSKMCRPLPVQASAVEARQHLVLPSCWQSIEGVCHSLYKNCFATVQPDQSSFHLDKSLAELSLILPCQVFPHHVHVVSVRHGCSSLVEVNQAIKA